MNTQATGASILRKWMSQTSDIFFAVTGKRWFGAAEKAAAGDALFWFERICVLSHRALRPSSTIDSALLRLVRAVRHYLTSDARL